MKKVLLAAAVLAFVGCNDGDLKVTDSLAGFEPRLAVSTASWPTTDIALVGDTDSADDVVVENEVATTDPSDVAIAVNGRDIYRIGRYGFDNITKLGWSEENEEFEVKWQYAVDANGNPQDFVVYDSSTAYVSQYGSQYLLRVDPSAEKSIDFIQAQIDLSKFSNGYAGGNNIPFMTDMVIVGDKLYVLLERLTAFWGVTDDSWVVVLDAATGDIIEPDNSSNVFNPVTDTLTSDFYINLGTSNAGNFSANGSTIYVVGRGDYNDATGDLADDSSILSFTPNDSDAGIIVDKLIEEDNGISFLGNLYTVDVNTITGDIYFVTYSDIDSDDDGYTDYGDNKVYVADSLGDNIQEIDLGSATAYNVADIAHDDDEVYFAVAGQFDGSENPGLKVYNIYDLEIDEDSFIETTLNPTQVLKM